MSRYSTTRILVLIRREGPRTHAFSQKQSRQHVHQRTRPLGTTHTLPFPAKMEPQVNATVAAAVDAKDLPAPNAATTAAPATVPAETQEMTVDAPADGAKEAAAEEEKRDAAEAKVAEVTKREKKQKKRNGGKKKNQQQLSSATATPANTENENEGETSVRKQRRQSKANREYVADSGIKRLSYRGGVKRISQNSCGACRDALDEFLQKVLKDATTYTECAKRNTVFVADVLRALEHSQSMTVYGYDNE